MDFFIYYIIMGQKNKNTTYTFKLISNHEQKMAKYFANMDFKIYYYVAIFFFFLYITNCAKKGHNVLLIMSFSNVWYYHIVKNIYFKTFFFHMLIQ